MTFSPGFLEVLLYAAIAAVVVGITTLAIVFITDWRGKRLW